MPAWPRSAARALAAFLLVSCGDTPGGPDDGGGDRVLPEQPNPADAMVTLDASLASSTRVPAAGGTVEATGSDGTVYTLTIPADALVSDTTITMTPITSVSGLALSGGRYLGVHLQPEGLRLFHHATLRVAPPEGARHSAIGLSYHGTGAEVHRHPLTPNPDLLEMKVLHFSGGMVYVGDNISIPASVEHITPTEWEDRIRSALELYLRGERERLLQGLPPDPELPGVLRNAIQEYYARVVEPSLSRMMTDCDYAQSAAPRALGWVREVQLLGFGDEFSSEQSAVRNAALAGLANCFQETAGSCLDTADPEQMAAAVYYSRTLQLLGVADPQYDVANPQLQCRSWGGTTTRTRDIYGTGSRDVVTATVEWEPDPTTSAPIVGVYAYRVKSGSFEWRMQGTDQRGCTVEGGPQTFPITPEDNVDLYLDLTRQVYYTSGAGREGGGPRYTQVTVTCPPPEQPYTADWVTGDWLVIPETPLPPNATELTGTFDFTGLNIRYEWRFTK